MLVVRLDLAVAQQQRRFMLPVCGDFIADAAIVCHLAN